MILKLTQSVENYVQTDTLPILIAVDIKGLSEL